MYNGVGLQTPRGSGTSGHVQRNCAALYKKEKPKHQNSDDSKLEINRQPNQEILEHNRKREIEVKCLMYQDTLEEQGYENEEEIESKVNSYRQILLETYEKSRGQQQQPELNEFGRPVVRDSHQSAEAQLDRNAKLRDAFGLEPSSDAT
ncbi:pre-mRNA-splicing factor CWC21 [Copidosoma floridanum]|uniref:pre-mRNA-splicing factor CWC21 n=1 Tax=Copidosoma floridanum TaxID=29053 RepID=UPI0006C98844|nr:pre-mRNA-splicing factor CWC21 [Copidosoma floridanum]XP_014207588.1 pre-mRNA-splicing factor CWC21 [Copidosoma floridanum]